MTLHQNNPYNARMSTLKNKFRVAIVGGPKTGKTTLSHQLADGANIAVRHTDELIPLGWSEASETAAQWFNDDGPWVIEGVAVARALRKWLRQCDTFRSTGEMENSTLTVKPCDRLIVLERPWVDLSAGQLAMGKGVFTVLDEVLPELVTIGVEIEWEQHVPPVGNVGTRYKVFS